MIPRLPRWLAIGGALIMAIGLGTTILLVVFRDRCTAHAGIKYGQDVSGAAAACSGYTTGIHWGYFVLGLGAALIVAAAISATNVVQRHSPAV